jgi:hypothetical protein
MRKFLGGLLALTIAVLPLSAQAVNDNRTTKWDEFTDSTVPANYDIQYVQYQEYKSEPNIHHFNAYMAGALTAGQFNTADGSWVGLIIDADLDGAEDYQIEFEGRDLVAGSLRPFDVFKKTRERWVSAPSCKGGVGMTYGTADITRANRFLTFEVDRSCLDLPNRFSWYFFIDSNGGNKANGYEIGPDDWLPVNHSLSTIDRSLTGKPSVNKVELFKNPRPDDLSPLDPNSTLGERLLEGTAEVRCKSRLRHGWVPNMVMPSTLTKAGYKSLVVTTFTGVQSCMDNRLVVVTTFDGRVAEGLVINWDSTANLALVAIAPALKGLRWQGEWPTEGLSAGVYTSIRSAEPSLNQTVITAAGPAELRLDQGLGGQEIDGLPVFDSQGGVLGTVIWDASVTQAVTRAASAPVLCQMLVSCGNGAIWDSRLTKYYGPQTLKVVSSTFSAKSSSLAAGSLSKATTPFKSKDVTSLACIGYYSAANPGDKALATKRARYLCEKISGVAGGISFTSKAQATKSTAEVNRVVATGKYLPAY